MKRFLAMLLAAVMLLAAAPAAQALDSSKSFNFDLSADGKYEVNKSSGDTITVTFKLERTDVSQQYVMHAVQNEIRYDSTFFQLTDVNVTSGVQYKDLGLAGSEQRELYINYLSQAKGGVTWNQEKLLCTFQMKIIGKSGSSTISCQDYKVSTADGMDSFNSSCRNLKVNIKDGGESGEESYTVSFRSNGGSAVAVQTVEAGGKITRPNNPTRTGYSFQGWYKNSALTQAWDFDSDTVTANTTLYAKWQKSTGGTSGTGTGGGTASTPRPSASASASPTVSPGPTPSASPIVTPAVSHDVSDAPILSTAPGGAAGNSTGTRNSLTVIDEADGWRFPWWLLILLLVLLILLVVFLKTRKTVEFITNGGEEVPVQKIHKGGRIRRPKEPKKAGAVFAGWFRDEQCTERWDFEEYSIEDNMNLYAKWL